LLRGWGSDHPKMPLRISRTGFDGIRKLRCIARAFSHPENMIMIMSDNAPNALRKAFVQLKHYKRQLIGSDMFPKLRTLLLTSRRFLFIKRIGWTLVQGQGSQFDPHKLT
jgi:hypothetical protein